MKRIGTFTKMLAILSGGVATLAWATVYTWKDENNQTHFSDTPRVGAQSVELHEVQTYGNPNDANATALTKPEAEMPRYTAIAITKPAHNATVRDNNGMVPVTVEVTPTFKDNGTAQLQYLLDGKPVDKPSTSTTLSLSNVDRGTHLLTVILLDSRGKTLMTSKPVSFHLHRTFKKPKK